MIPPDTILAKELHEKTRKKLAQEITDRILKAQDAEGQIEQAFKTFMPVLDEKVKELAKDVTEDMTKKLD